MSDSLVEIAKRRLEEWRLKPPAERAAIMGRLASEIEAVFGPEDDTPEEEPESVMPRVDGVTFRCRCDCNVFTRRGDIYVCNACQTKYEGTPATCHAGMDGDCEWEKCPQSRDGEPKATGRHCPLPHFTDDPEW